MFDRNTALFVIAMLAAPASAQVRSDVDDPSAGRDIVVTGIPLQKSEDRLKQCIARKCPPAEDIAATLAHAENNFVAGNYQTARTTLLASLDRNRRYDKTLPVEVSNLLRANGRVAAHLGEKEVSLSSSRDVVRALKAGLPDGDPRTISAEIELGDDIARTGDVYTAVSVYRSAIRNARKYDRPLAEAHARLHMANLYIALSESEPAFKQAASREIAALSAESDPTFAPFAAAAKLAQAKLSAKRGDQAAIDQMIKEYKTAGTSTRPMLIYAPQVINFRSPREYKLETSRLDRLQVNNVDDQWVDIGFWVSADGTVSNVDTLRESPQISGGWYKPIVTAIAGRRYAAYTPPAGKDGTLRVERYTLTANWTTTTGTRMRVRGPSTRVEMVDLTS